jgi:O-antigen/teichoic acid export membrane protein
MSIRRNIVANYVGQLYAALIGILLVPMYLRYMGVEAYGLVGFYTMLQGWFMLLDLGLTPTLGREAARFNGSAISALELRQLLRAFEGVFLVLGAVGALTLVAAAGTLAEHWLKAQRLDPAEVRLALVLMAPVIALRWVGGLYRSAVTGLEHIVWLSGFNVAIATLRFVLVVPYLIHVGATPAHFFAYQLGVAVLELSVIAGKTYRLLPPLAKGGPPIRWEWVPLRGVLHFTVSSALLAAMWVAVTQTDKLIVSGMVPLTDYAHFSLAVLVAGGITLLASPVAGAVLPRLTRLHAQGDEAGFVRLYRQATQVVSVIATPIVLVLALFPVQVLAAWTGQPTIARHAAPVLALYALGNGLLALSGFPYFLQAARGQLRLHLLGNFLFILLFVPLLLVAVSRWGVVGAGYAWFAANLLPFLIWLPIVHRYHLRGLHLDWLSRDIVAIIVPPAAAAVLMERWVDWPQSRPVLAAALLAAFLMLTLLAACSSSSVRHRLRARLQAGLA